MHPVALNYCVMSFQFLALPHFWRVSSRSNFFDVAKPGNRSRRHFRNGNGKRDETSFAKLSPGYIPGINARNIYSRNCLCLVKQRASHFTNMNDVTLLHSNNSGPGEGLKTYNSILLLFRWISFHTFAVLGSNSIRLVSVIAWACSSWNFRTWESSPGLECI